jgi:tyrosinase
MIFPGHTVSLSITVSHSFFSALRLMHSVVTNIVAAHDAAPFLPWHRYFIHVYEMALRQDCGYNGHLAYWDWTLDWKDPAQSPIWDPETGFGGNGDLNGTETVFSGRCVKDGPFADYTVHYSNNTIKPHCLSRGFGCMEDSGRFDGTFLSPRLVEISHHKTTYFDFLLALEAGPHNAMPNGVCGDFYSFDAPAGKFLVSLVSCLPAVVLRLTNADPVFYLHHVQLDRLWWLWQQEQPSRTMEYNGRTSGHSQAQASLNDTLPMHGLAREPRVEEVMDAQGGLLCYEY